MGRGSTIKYFLIIGFIIFILLEIGLRIFGLAPGQIYKNKWVQKVDNLIVNNTFIADSNGIFKVNTNILDSLSQIDGNEISSLYFDHKENRKNAYNKLVNQVQNKEQRTELEQAILEYNINPINQDGFYSIPFIKFNNETKQKVLLLGDSFTWGHTTTNKTNSFANELIAKGYIVYNTGISGVDVAQYEAIAKKYIPILKPDIVILNFFMGNDIQYYKRKLEAFHPVYYNTNAGNIMAFQNGIEFYSAESAYKAVINQMFISPSNFNQEIVIKSSVLTQLWKIWCKLGLTSNSTNIKQGKILKKPACNEEIENIISICKKNTAKFELVVIPAYLSGKINVQDFPYLFENIDYTMSSVPKNYYNMNDGHFNDEGHQKYAEFLDSLIKSVQ